VEAYFVEASPKNTWRTVFAQVLSVVPFKHFEHLVNKHQSNRWTGDFPGWSHVVCMAYAQLTRREGLRDLYQRTARRRHTGRSVRKIEHRLPMTTFWILERQQVSY
jgi:hypothetical protein